MNLKFKTLHATANGNILLEPIDHKEPIGQKMRLTLNGKKTAEIFDTIANVENPLYLAKLLTNEDLTGKILIGGK